MARICLRWFSKRLIARWLAGKLLKTKDGVRFHLGWQRMGKNWDKDSYLVDWLAVCDPPNLLLLPISFEFVRPAAYMASLYCRR